MSGVHVDKRTNLGGQRVVIRGYGNDQKFNNWVVKFYLNAVPLTNADNTTVLEGIDFSLINSRSHQGSCGNFVRKRCRWCCTVLHETRN